MSKEEILEKHLNLSKDKNNWNNDICKLNNSKSYKFEIEAMQEYADQQTKPLIDEIELLKSELKFAKSQNRNYLSFLKQRNELIETIKWIENEAYNAGTCNTQMIVNKCRTIIKQTNKR